MSSSISFYDPLYDKVAFERRFYRVGDRATKNFHEIIGTYEVNRLKFLRQEGISWLAFPSASYTRFLSALGYWFLADFALDNVQVYSEAKKEDAPWLIAWVKNEKLLDEFRLATLLRNIGTFPFNNSLENNDKLKSLYSEREETEGIQLRHEDFTVSLIKGENDNSIFKLYKKYLKKKHGRLQQEPNRSQQELGKIDENRLISSLFKDRGLKHIDRDWLIYLIDPNQKMPANTPEDKRRLGGLVRHLVRGLIDVGMMDRANRASNFICGVGSLVNSRRILQSVLLDVKPIIKAKEEGGADAVGDPRIVLFNDGPRDVIDALYEVQNVLTRYVLHNPRRMAYEVMLNHAINTAWESTSEKNNEKAKHFKTYFPFMDDDEFFREISDWDNDDVLDLIQRIQFGNPYSCVGRFKVKTFDDEKVSMDQTEKVEQERRNTIIGEVEKLYAKEKYLIRLSETFGRPKKQDAGQSLAAYIGPPSKRDSWLDPFRLYAIGSSEDIKVGKPPDEFQNYIPNRLVELFANYMNEARHTFWLFAPKWKKEDSKIIEIEKRLDVTFERDC